jgi:outer membrane protein assembly factor BamB
MPQPHITSVQPRYAVEGGRVTLLGSAFVVNRAQLPDLRVHGQPARIVFASATRLSFLIPSGILESGPAAIQLDDAEGEATFVNIAAPVATGLHQVDNPAIDDDGNLYLTYSGTRGQQVPVSIFRVGLSGTRETYSSGIVNPTSMAFDREGHLYVSSRFEGTVYRVGDDGSAETFATDLGITCGLAFAPDGTLFVGDRSGTIFAIDRFGHATTFASLPSSVAAFHLAIGADALFVAGPTLSPRDTLYRVGFDGTVSVHSRAFGRPQGLAVDPEGTLFVIEALAGSSGLYRLADDHGPELVLAGSGLVGVAFDRKGGLVVCSNDTAYRLPNFS